ncbi:cation transporter [Carboxylicivirga linearis]|uniref:Heavy-metal-associated domain-containing protein n=1 Tax=Carboxylicivirga linearis TaxID=1628157 RepID=A0ABS5JQ05_9BACT|nr:cation transporter [Carboxylicivirga linearis]MBS2096894.1 heavy-metal-associated domain-containing protein [Carboxylicivirga linearis]
MRKILSVLFLMVLVLGACNTKKSEQKEDQPVSIENVGKIELNVEGMTCDGCEMTIEKGLLTLEGVAEVKADHETGKTIIKADTVRVNRKDLVRIIEKVGYKAKE